MSTLPVDSALTITTTPKPLEGVSITVTGAPTFSVAGSTDATGTWAAGSFTPGSYHVHATLTDYQDYDQDFTIPSNASLQILMVESDSGGDDGDPDDAPPPAASDSAGTLNTAAAGISSPAMNADTCEKIYGNNAFEGYFTSAQARVYVGNIFIDELQSIQYQNQTNVVPIFGYASQFFDALADGKNLVQGQLVVNYVSEAYMFTILQEYKNRFAMPFMAIGPVNPDASASDQQNGQSLANLITARQNGVVSSASQSMSDVQIAALASSPGAVQIAKQKLSGGAGFDPVYVNACYRKIPFDMRIEIGTGNNRTYRQLESCRIVSNEQIIDQSGDIIGDAFGFIARRLR